MDEIKLYYDREGKNEIKDEIIFEKIVAGETTRKSIFIINKIRYPMDVEIKLTGDDIEITKSIEKLSPEKIESVEFEFTPKITRMKPLKAKLKINIEYIMI